MSLASTCSVPFFLPILPRVASILPSMLLRDWPEDGMGRPAQRRAQPNMQARTARRRIGGRAAYDTCRKSPAKRLAHGIYLPGADCHVAFRKPLISRGI